ncbi:hypothetical protein FACS1894125_6310 [Actinomycetota bacterium]|nr:hypothetical protein FACS1894125_6310 [Actinomycetota bacterium]
MSKDQEKPAKVDEKVVEKAADKKADKSEKLSIIGRLVTFVRQILSEMKKVVTPTKDELVEYTIVVLVFVLVIMLFITGVDVVIGKIVMALFAK